MSQTRPAVLKPGWINDETVRKGFIEVDGKRLVIQAGEYASNQEMEERVLAGILSAGEVGNSRTAMKRIGFLRHDDFFWRVKGLLFRAMEGIFQQGNEIDQLILADFLRKIPFGQATMLEYVGGESYLARLAAGSSTNLESYARTVARDSFLRTAKVHSANLGQFVDRAAKSNLSLDDVLAEFHRTRTDLDRRYAAITSEKRHNLYDAMTEHMALARQQFADETYEAAIPTGFTGLDKSIIGWMIHKLYIFAAPSGWGKTAWLLCIALKMLLQGKRVLYLSLEMPENELYDRLLCIQAGVDGKAWASRDMKKISPRDLVAIEKAYEEIQGSASAQHFFVVRLKHPTMKQIRTIVDEHFLNPGVDMVIIDYVNVNMISNLNDENKPLIDAFSHMSYVYDKLQSLKDDYPLPFVVATQMNRDWDSKKGKRPGESDLFFGSVGQFAADVIGFIYHEWMAKPDDPTIPKDVAELILRKVRLGSKSGSDVTIELIWEAFCTRFSDRPEQRRIWDEF